MKLAKTHLLDTPAQRHVGKRSS